MYLYVHDWLISLAANAACLERRGRGTDGALSCVRSPDVLCRGSLHQAEPSLHLFLSRFLSLLPSQSLFLSLSMCLSLLPSLSLFLSHSFPLHLFLLPSLSLSVSLLPHLLLLLLLLLPAHLQPQPDTLGHCCLGEGCLHLRYQFASQLTSFRTNQVALLLDAGHHGKVEWEVGGDDATDSLLHQLLLALQVWREQRGAS